jgi:hypothetical protein
VIAPLSVKNLKTMLDASVYKIITHGFLRVGACMIDIITAVCESNGTSPTVRKYRYVRET